MVWENIMRHFHRTSLLARPHHQVTLQQHKPIPPLPRREGLGEGNTSRGASAKHAREPRFAAGGYHTGEITVDCMVGDKCSYVKVRSSKNVASA